MYEDCREFEQKINRVLKEMQIKLNYLRENKVKQGKTK